MAAQTVHARHGSNTSSTMSSLGYPTAPGSPTLTNPDMILPDYDVPLSPDRSESPLAMWSHARSDATNGNGQFEAAQNSSFIAGPVSPTTPIIYGNGTMLSDIGEVTEVESTVGRSPVLSRRFDHKPVGESTASRTSPPAGAHAGVKQRSKAQHERRASNESNSTATTVQDHGDHFADFDDAVSVDDSNFQGDDEESVAESNLEDMSARQTKFLPPPQGTGLNNDEKRYSAISISQRAEEILANAKRRLTTMEGNLTRARTSLHSASPSNSSIGSVTPSPPVGKTTSSATSPTSAPSHSRMLSEGAIGNDASAQQTTRSASALGAAGGYRQPMPASQSLNDLGAIYTRRNITHHPINLSLDSLGEEEAKTDGRSGPDSAKLDNFLSPTFGSNEDQGLTRSTSVMQMRDLKDQMQGLKGKISTLREQAREDSLKRRSLQSLRTPSPFTHARVDQWYAGPVRPHPSGTGSTPLGRNPWNGELESIDGEGVMRDENKTPTQGTPEEDEESVISVYVAAQEDLREEDDRLSTAQVASVNVENVPHNDNDADDDKDDMRTEDGYQEDEEEAEVAQPEEAEAYEEDVNDDASDYGSESGESIYHDTHQEAVSHEDREDAFDYEHFFLHSAMGSFSQRRLGRRGSFSSEDSVETTKGPITSSEVRSQGGHRRQGSSDTVTTMDSFATATEGRSSRAQVETSEDKSDDEDEVGEHQFEGFDDDQTTPLEEKEEEETSRPETPVTATRGAFGAAFKSPSNNSQPRASPLAKHSASASYSYSNPSSGDERGLPLRQRSTSVIYSRPFSNAAAAARSRPSISSFDSAGTQRSFPLINKSKLGSGVMTPQGTPPQGSPDPTLRHVSESLMSEAASVCEKSSSGGVNGVNGVSGSVGAGAAADAMVMQQLAREDQILVERLVAGLGKCVLGLSESSKASSESRAYRRRIEAARRLLEGADEPR